MNLNRLIHIDLKGCPIKLDYLKNVLTFTKKIGCNGILIEYEDMFPFTGVLSTLSRSDAYNKEELTDFLNFCENEELIVIPLAQTFGHLEYVLKQESLRHLRENFKYTMTICPSFEESNAVLKEIINQIVNLHPHSKFFHIGADEVFDLGVCQNCKMHDLDDSRLFLEHVVHIAGYVKKEKGLQPIMWDDMLRGINMKIISGAKLQDVIEPMIWNYAPLLNLEDSYLQNLVSVFPRVWAASAFKGANGAVQQMVNTSVYVKNNQSWISKIRQLNELNLGQFVGIALTGWSRFDHFASLCEILPASIPCLALCLQIVTTGVFTAELHEKVSISLGFPELIPWEPMIKCVDPGCQLDFPGYDVYQAVSGWFLLQFEVKQLLDSDYMHGWLSKYHRTRLIGNAATVGVLVGQIDSLHTRLLEWKKIFEPCFQKMLTPAAAAEWMTRHVDSVLAKLHKRASQGRKVIACGDSVFDRAKLEAGDA